MKHYLGDGFEAQTYPDSQNLFTLGRAAVYPGWFVEISGFNAQADFEMVPFRRRRRERGRRMLGISDHTDIAIGLNAASAPMPRRRGPSSKAGSAEFATLYANALPGSFSLNSAPVEMG